MKLKLTLLAVCTVIAVSTFLGCNSSTNMTGQTPKNQMGMEVGQMGGKMDPSMSSKKDGMMSKDMQPMMDEKMSPKMDDAGMKK
jgi:hypothetical protein